MPRRRCSPTTRRSSDYLDVIAHQRYGPQVAVPRLLRMLDRLGLRTTFFIPGRVAETWPDVARSVRDAGHEIGHHGYLHESVRGVDEATEIGYLERGLAALDEVLGVRPTGYRAPSWDMNFRTPGLLAGARLPIRLGADGFGPSVSPRDRAWVRTPRRSSSCPCHWSLDDWNRYNYVPGLTGTGVIGRPSQVCAAWAEELDAIVEVGGLFSLTMHPFVSGRPARAAALEAADRACRRDRRPVAGGRRRDRGLGRGPGPAAGPPRAPGRRPPELQRLRQFPRTTSVPTIPYASWPGRWQMNRYEPGVVNVIVVVRVVPAGIGHLGRARPVDRLGPGPVPLVDGRVADDQLVVDRVVVAQHERDRHAGRDADPRLVVVRVADPDRSR